MQLRIKFTINGHTETVSTNLFTIVEWERKYSRKSSQVREQGLGVEDIAFMAHETAKMLKLDVPAKLDDFLKALEDLETLEAVPNPKAAEEPTATD